MFTSSLGAGLDPYAVKPVTVDGERKYERKHNKEHLDCLVGTNTSKPQFFVRDSLNHIQKIRPLAIASFPGLNTNKLLGKRWCLYPEPHLVEVGNAVPTPLPAGKYKGKTIPQVVKSFKDSKIAAIIYGSNNRIYFEKNKHISPEKAVKMFFQELELVFNESQFEMLFISTIFPRGEDLNEKGELISQIKEFNDLLLLPYSRTNPNFKINIKSHDGKEKQLKWDIIDMTDLLVYREMKDPKYFCQLNNYKKFKDLIHVNKKYLSEFYLRLDTKINKYKIIKKRYGDRPRK